LIYDRHNDLDLQRCPQFGRLTGFRVWPGDPPAGPDALKDQVTRNLKDKVAKEEYARLTECIDVRPLVSVKPVKQRFCLANVGNLKALRECPVHRFKDLPCVGLPVLLDPEMRKA